MATRFYLPSSGTAPANPTVSGDWEHNNAVRRPTRTARSGTSIADTSYSPDAADDLTNGDSMFVQFVGPPMLPQTIGAQTIKYALQGSETNNGNNCSITVKVFVCSNDGNTIKETLLAIQRDGTELTTTVTNRTDSGTSSSATVEEGDRLVFEFGIGGTPTASGGVQGHNGALRFGDNQATDLAENDTDTGSTNNPWLEFANNIAFIEQVTPTTRQPIEEAGAQAIRNTTNVKRSLGAIATAMACAFVPVVAAASTADAAANSDAGSLAAARVIQYQALHGPIAIPAVAAIPDQWWPAYPDRIPRTQPRNPLGRAVFETVPEPAPQAADAGQGGDTGGLSKALVLFYQGITGPVAIPAAVVASDQPSAVYPSRIQPLLRAAEFQAWTAPPFVPDVTHPVTALSWAPEYPDRIPPVRALGAALQRAYVADRFDAPGVVVAPDLTPPVYPNRIATHRPRLVGISVVPSYVPDVTQPVTALSWTPRYPNAIDRKAALRTASQRALAWNPNTPAVQAATEVIAGYIGGDFVGKTALAQYQSHSGPVAVAFVAPFDAALVPRIVLPQPSRVRFSRAAYTWGQEHFGVIVEVPVQSWLGNTLQQPRIHRRTLHPSRFYGLTLDRFQAPDPAVVPDLSWQPEYPDRLNPPRALRAAYQRAYQADRFQAPDAIVAPDITPSVYPNRIDRAKPRLAGISVVPAFVPDVTHPVTALSWSPEYPDRIFPVRALLAALKLAYAADRFTAPAEVIAPEITPPIYPSRIETYKPRLAGLSVVPAFVPDVTQPATALSWRPEYPAIIFPARTLRTAFQRAYVADRFDAPDVVEAPDLSWLSRYPDRIDGRIQTREGRLVVPSYVPDVTQPVVALAWSPAYPDRIIRLRVHPSQMPTHWWNTEIIPITHIAVTELEASYIPVVMLDASYIPSATLPASVE